MSFSNFTHQGCPSGSLSHLPCPTCVLQHYWYLQPPDLLFTLFISSLFTGMLSGSQQVLSNFCLVLVAEVLVPRFMFHQLNHFLANVFNSLVPLPFHSFTWPNPNLKQLRQNWQSPYLWTFRLVAERDMKWSWRMSSVFWKQSTGS